MFKKESSYRCLCSKKKFAKDLSPLEELLNKKLLEDQEMNMATRSKTGKPWKAEELDINSMVTKKTRLRPISVKRQKTEVLRSNSYQKGLGSSMKKVLEENSVVIDQTVKFPRNLRTRAVSLPRQKIYSCKIALKKGVFPMNEKKKENEIEDIFKVEEEIS